jgi:hypothetical protein
MNRPAIVSQADVARVIRAAKKAGLEIARIVVRPDGVAVETRRSDEPNETVEPKPEVVL